MKLYYFNPNNYGEQFFTVAESEEQAIDNLNKYLEKTDYPKKDWFTKESLTWTDDYFKKYTIDSFEPGEVLNSEIA
jgi:hypothetical protein